MQNNTCGKPPAAGGLLRRIRDLFDPRRVMRRQLTRLVAVAFALVALIGFGTFAILRLAETTSEEPLPPMRDQIYHDYSAMLQFYPERNDLRMPTAEEMRFLAPLWPRIPPERNAAFYFAKAVSLMTWEDAPPGSASVGECYAGDRAAFERWVRASQPALNAVLQGLAMETCRFPVFMDRKTGHPELGTGFMGLLASVRHIGRTCADAGFVMELGENPEGAAEWYMACMRLGEYVRRDSVLIENFVGVALCLIGQAPLDALVANAPLSDDTLKKVIAACRSAEATSGELSRIWVAEEAFVQASVRSGKKRIRPRGLHRKIQKVVALPLPELLRKSGRDRLLKKKFTIYESAKMAARPRGVRRGFPTFSFFSWVRQQVLLDLMMRVTRIRAAIALFQRRHGGKAPEDLEALCPEILPKVPIDPFSGKPMRYARIGDGWKLWSVGDDHVDNQGRGTPWPTPRGCRRAPDIIFTSTRRTSIERRSGGKLSAAEPMRSLSWAVRPSKEAILPGEPVLLIVSTRNAGKREVCLDFGTDGIEAFTMEVRDTTGRTVEKGLRITTMGISRIGKRVVPAGSTIEKRIILNRWCSTRLPEGEYQVALRVEPKLGEAAQISCGLKVLKADEKKLTKILSDLAEKAKAPSHSRQLLACMMLSFCDAPEGVMYQVLLAKDRKLLIQWRELAIKGLVRVGSLEAAKQVTQLCEDASLPETLRRTAIIGVYKLREMGELDILAATEEITTRYQRPVEAKHID